jgi:hypothetical protein
MSRSEIGGLVVTSIIESLANQVDEGASPLDEILRLESLHVLHRGSDSRIRALAFKVEGLNKTEIVNAISP